MTSEEREIHHAHEKWIEAVNTGNPDRLLTLAAGDAVFLTPERPPFGLEVLSANFAGAHRQLRLHCTSELEEVVVSGDIAFTRSRDTLSMSPRAGGQTTSLAIYRMTLWRRDPQGRWILARDAHTRSAANEG